MRHSGLQKEVLALYKTALKAAKKKDLELLQKSEPAQTVAFVRERFRDDAFSVRRNDFNLIEFLLRKGKKDLKMMESMTKVNYMRMPQRSQVPPPKAPSA